MPQRRNIVHLIIKLSVYAAGEAPVHLLNQLDDEEARIAELEHKLDTLHADDDKQE